MAMRKISYRPATAKSLSSMNLGILHDWESASPSTGGQCWQLVTSTELLSTGPAMPMTATEGQNSVSSNSYIMLADHARYLEEVFDAFFEGLNASRINGLLLNDCLVFSITHAQSSKDQSDVSATYISQEHYVFILFSCLCLRGC